MVWHRKYLLFTACGFLLLGLFYLHSLLATASVEAKLMPAKQQLVSTLGLSDLAIWTEARYTRHPTQADHFTPFQDLPASFGHFPAGSIISPLGSHVGTKMQFRRASERPLP